MRSVLSAFFFLSSLAPLVWAGFPASFNSGAAVMESSPRRSENSCGYLSGAAANATTKTTFGYLAVSRLAYQTFLNTDPPVAISPAPDLIQNGRILIRPDRSVVLEWDRVLSQVPLHYNVYLWKKNQSPVLAGTTDSTSFKLSNLDFVDDYNWRVDVVDIYGRTATGPILALALAPEITHFFCAPNPFRAGRESATFLFTMPGAGSADFTVFALPNLQTVFSAHLSGLFTGANSYLYDGNDTNGLPLFNGTYLAVIEMKGDQNVRQKFKFVVAR